MVQFWSQSNQVSSVNATLIFLIRVIYQQFAKDLTARVASLAYNLKCYAAWLIFDPMNCLILALNLYWYSLEYVRSAAVAFHIHENFQRDLHLCNTSWDLPNE